MRFKKVKPELVLVILLTVITIMSFNKIAGNKNNTAGGSVRGTVMPPEATPPYRNGVKDGISVTDGQFTDAGQLELQK